MVKKNKINKGEIIGNTYYKNVNFSKAVLWRDREISLHKDVGDYWLTDKIKFIKFIDRSRNESWTTRVDRVKKVWKLRQVGQEPQYYIPIEVFITKKTIDMKQPTLI